MPLNMLATAVQVGGYISPIKALVAVILLMIWVRLMVWADKDAEAAFLPREHFGTANACGLIIGLVLFFYLPLFWIAFPVLLLIFVVEVAVYLSVRRQKVGLKDLKENFKEWIRSFGPKKKEASAAAGELQFISHNKKKLASPADDSPERVGYDGLQRLLTDPLKKGFERLDLTPVEGAAQVNYWVDGAQYNSGTIERNIAAETIHYAKTVAGMDVNDRRKPQTGKMKVGLRGDTYNLQIRSAGSAAGESMRILVNPETRHTIKLADLGFSEAQLEKIKQSIAARNGIALVAAPREQGLTTLMYALVRSHDVFTEHIHSIERNPEDELEGVTQNKLPKTASAEEETKLAAWVLDQEPDVVVVTDIQSPATAKLLAQWAGEGKRVYVTLRAGSTFEALNQWRKLVGNDQVSMKSLDLVVAGRVTRRLCDACKISYHPDTATLKKLNMDPSKVTELFQARNQPLRDPKGNPIPCDFCHDLRYKGRIGFYEVLEVNDDIRQAVLAGESGALKSAFRKQSGRYLQEQALALVEAGRTSVNEVLRSLRGGSSGGSSRPGSSGRPASPGRPPRPAPKATSSVPPPVTAASSAGNADAKT